MKACVIFILVVAVAGLNAHTVHLSGEQKEIADKIVAECVKETGVKTEVIVEAKKGTYSDDEGMKKFIACFFKKSGIVNSDGKLNIEVALAKLPADVDKAEAEKALSECKDKTGKDDVSTIYEIFQCYHKRAPTHVIF